MANQWSKEEHSYLQALVDNAERKTWTVFAREMSKTFGKPFKREQVRGYWRMNVRGTEMPVKPVDSNKRQTEILADGSIKTSRLVAISEEQEIDAQFLLEAFGFDHTEWELTGSKVGEWNQHNKHDGTVVLRSCSITVKPRVTKITERDIIDTFTSEIKPVEIKVNYVGENNLVIPLADLHFGVLKLEHTLEKLDEIKSIIQNGYKTIVIEQLGDLFHSSQMKSSQTLKGTLLDDVDMVQAIEDAKTFYDVIITESLKHSKETRVESAPGNHSGNMEYMFLLYLETKYPELIVNRHNDNRSAYLLDNVGIMLAHGDAAKAKLPHIFAYEFKMVWAQSETMEIHTGHFHSIEKEVGGVVIRQMGTIKPNDDYEIVNGWVTNRKVIQLIEYDSDRAKVIYEI